MSELFRPIALDALTRGPTRLTLLAEPAELAAIAARLGLPAIRSLDAGLTVRRRDSRVRVIGTFRADLDQRCVVSLEAFPVPVAGAIEEEFFLTDATDSVEVELNPDDIVAEPLSGDTIDLGEIVVQNLSLAIDPYPRAPGADLAALDYADRAADAADNPFAALRQRHPGQ